MKTYAPKPADIERRWYVIDADGAVLGRLATEVASILRGKHKPIWAPHADTGDHVIVINAGNVRLTGGKETKKVAYRHSGYPGGLTATQYGRLMSERPSFVVEKAVKGMLPHNRLGRAMAKKLSVYEGSDHPHGAQKPQELKLGETPKWDGLPARKPLAAAKAEAAPARKPAARKPAAKPTARPTAKKTTAAKPAAKKTTTKKTTTKKTAAPRKPAAKKAPARKPAARKPAKDPEE